MELGSIRFFYFKEMFIHQPVGREQTLMNAEGFVL